MGDATAQDLAVELQRRITQLSYPAALAAINRAVRWILRQGSFTFQGANKAILSVDGATGNCSPPATFDEGKAHHIVQVSTGLPVPKSGIQDLSNDNFTSIPSNLQMFACYTISNGLLKFHPPQNTPLDIELHYIAKSLDLTDAVETSLPREFDDVIVDLAEAEERRIYDVGEIWVPLLARCQDQIKLMLAAYSVVSQSPEPQQELAMAAAEKTQIGRQ